jgi:HPt (histidine-containing phosphotransfer) domain-containing protein
VAAQAHFMISICGNVGVTRASDLARALEQAAKAQNAAGVEDISRTLYDEVVDSS